MTAAAIEFQNVTKVYRRVFREEQVTALSCVSFEAGAGEVCAFLGRGRRAHERENFGSLT